MQIVRNFPKCTAAFPLARVPGKCWKCWKCSIIIIVKLHLIRFHRIASDCQADENNWKWRMCTNYSNRSASGHCCKVLSLWVRTPANANSSLAQPSLERLTHFSSTRRSSNPIASIASTVSRTHRHGSVCQSVRLTRFVGLRTSKQLYEHVRPSPICDFSQTVSLRPRWGCLTKIVSLESSQ